MKQAKCIALIPY